MLAGKGEMFTRGSTSLLQSRQSRVDLELRGNKIDNCPKQFSSLYSVKEEIRREWENAGGKE